MPLNFPFNTIRKLAKKFVFTGYIIALTKESTITYYFGSYSLVDMFIVIA